MGADYRGALHSGSNVHWGRRDARPLATQPPGGDSRGAAWAESVVDRRKVATTSDSRTD